MSRLRIIRTMRFEDGRMGFGAGALVDRLVG